MVSSASAVTVHQKHKCDIPEIHGRDDDDVQKGNEGVYTAGVFCLLHPTSPSVSMERALLPSISVHPLCMTNLHCQDTDGARGKERESARERGR